MIESEVPIRYSNRNIYSFRSTRKCSVAEFVLFECLSQTRLNQDLSYKDEATWILDSDYLLLRIGVY